MRSPKMPLINELFNPEGIPSSTIDIERNSLWFKTKTAHNLPNLHLKSLFKH